MSRLFTAYNQCVGRTGQLENRFDQFCFEIRRDATELALILQGHEQRISTHSRELRQLNDSLEDAQNKITGLENLSRTIIDHDSHVTQEFDRVTHSQTASICGLIKEQEDLRKMIEDLAGRFDRSQDSLSTPQDEASTGVLLDLGDLKNKVARLIEQQTETNGDVSFLKTLHTNVEELGKQVIKWNRRLPDFNDVTDEDGDKVPTTIEVQEELTDLTNVSYTKFHSIFGRLQALENMVGTLGHSRDESWEAVSNRVSTLVESSVTSLSGRLTELENALHSHRTTPIEPDDAGVNAEAWAASEQVIWSELGRVKEQLQDVPRLQEVLEKIQSAQQSHEKQLGALRRFSKNVEQHLEQIANGALPPRQFRQTPVDDRCQGVTQTYVPGASASSSAVPATTLQVPTPPVVPPPPIPTIKDQLSSHSHGSSVSSQVQPKAKPHFSTVIGQVRAGAIRMDITNPEEWAVGDVAVIRNQEAKKVRDLGSLIFDTPIQHDYEEGVEVRSLLSTEQLEEVGGRLAIVDTSPTSGRRVVRFWVDDPSAQDDGASDARTPRRTEQAGVSTSTRQHAEGGVFSRKS